MSDRNKNSNLPILYIRPVESYNLLGGKLKISTSIDRYSFGKNSRGLDEEFTNYAINIADHISNFQLRNSFLRLEEVYNNVSNSKLGVDFLRENYPMDEYSTDESVLDTLIIEDIEKTQEFGELCTLLIKSLGDESQKHKEIKSFLREVYKTTM